MHRGLSDSICTTRGKALGSLISYLRGKSLSMSYAPLCVAALWKRIAFIYRQIKLACENRNLRVDSHGLMAETMDEGKKRVEKMERIARLQIWESKVIEE